MKHFIRGTFALFFIIIVSSCQRPPDYQGEKPVYSLDSVVEIVKPGLSEGAEETREVPAVTLTIQGNKNSDTHIVVKVGSKLDNGHLVCRVITEATHALAGSMVAFRLHSPFSPDGLPNKDFISALKRFTQKPKLDNRIEFLLWFNYASYFHTSLWRITAQPVIDPMTKQEVGCRAVADICDDTEYDATRDLRTCKTRNWPRYEKLEAEGGLDYDYSKSYVPFKTLKKIIGKPPQGGGVEKVLKPSAPF
jgi:hypothetical protein